MVGSEFGINTMKNALCPDSLVQAAGCVMMYFSWHIVDPKYLPGCCYWQCSSILWPQCTIFQIAISSKIIFHVTKLNHLQWASWTWQCGPKEHPGDEVEQEQDGAAIHLCLHLTLSLLCSLHLQFTAAKNSITWTAHVNNNDCQSLIVAVDSVGSAA